MTLKFSPFLRYQPFCISSMLSNGARSMKMTKSNVNYFNIGSIPMVPWWINIFSHMMEQYIQTHKSFTPMWSKFTLTFELGNKVTKWKKIIIWHISGTSEAIVFIFSMHIDFDDPILNMTFWPQFDLQSQRSVGIKK